MNKLLTLSLVMLTVTTVCAKDDFITAAINASNPDKVEAFVEAQYPVTWEKKEAYLELARQKVTEAEKACTSLSFGARPMLVNLELLIAFGIVVFTGKQIHDQYNDTEPKNWKGRTVFTLACLGLMKHLISFTKDYSKKEDAIKKLKDAKKVLVQVELLQIDS